MSSGPRTTSTSPPVGAIGAGAYGVGLAAALVGRRVLVTGHTGFKGAWLCHWLLSLGAEVGGLALAPPSEPALFDLLGLSARMADDRGDIRDPAAVERAMARQRPEVVIHMAAQSLVRAGYARPAETFAVNAQGTANVLDCIRTRRWDGAGGRVVVLVVTSDKCYHPPRQPRHHDEDDPLGGPDPYSASKACAEIVTEAYRRSYFDPSRHQDHGVALASVRAGNVIGGGDWAADRLVPDLARAVAAGGSIGVRNPRAVRPWQHVLDALSGYLWLTAKLVLAQGRAEGPELARLCGPWNFGPDDADAGPGVDVGQIVDRMIAAWGRGLAQDASDPRAPHEAPHLGLSIAKARRELGWGPTWDVDRCVAATVDWYRAVIGEPDPAARAREATDRQLREYALAAAACGQPWARA